MALITGLPNFFGAATPTATDVNNAAKAIGTQLGAEYWDVAAGPAYAQATGNLNSTNIAAAPAFKNCQKAESFSYFTLSVSVKASTISAANVITQWLTLPLFPPLGFHYYITNINIDGLGSSPPPSVTVSTQSSPAAIVVYMNDTPTAAVSAGGFPESSGLLPVHFPLGNMHVGPGDAVTVDLSQLTFSYTTAPTLTFSNGVCVAMLCKAPHVRKNL